MPKFKVTLRMDKVVRFSTEMEIEAADEQTVRFVADTVQAPSAFAPVDRVGWLPELSGGYFTKPHIARIERLPETEPTPAEIDSSEPAENAEPALPLYEECADVWHKVAERDAEDNLITSESREKANEAVREHVRKNHPDVKWKACPVCKCESPVIERHYTDMLPLTICLACGCRVDE